MRNLVWALLLIGLNIAIAELKIQGDTEVIYDRTPKLYISGTGFDAEDHDITLELSATDESPLRSGKDFQITKSDKGLILKLLSSRRFVLVPFFFCNHIRSHCSDDRKNQHNFHVLKTADGLVLPTKFRRSS